MKRLKLVIVSYISKGKTLFWMFVKEVNGVFILPDPRPIKMGCIELCGGVHTAPKQRLIQVSIEFSANLSASVSVWVSVSVLVLGNVNAPLILKPEFYRPQTKFGEKFFLTPVSDSVHKGGLSHCMLGYTSPRQTPAPGQTPPPRPFLNTTGYGQQADGTNHTRMHTCFSFRRVSES